MQRDRILSALKLSFPFLLAAATLLGLFQNCAKTNLEMMDVDNKLLSSSGPSISLSVNGQIQVNHGQSSYTFLASESEEGLINFENTYFSVTGGSCTAASSYSPIDELFAPLGKTGLDGGESFSVGSNVWTVDTGLKSDLTGCTYKVCILGFDPNLEACVNFKPAGSVSTTTTTTPVTTTTKAPGSTTTTTLPSTAGQCKAYTSVYTSQPASSTSNGCTSGVYADATDTTSQWKWSCGSVSCAANKVTAATTTTTTTTTPPSSGGGPLVGGGTIDTNCLNNSAYDACVFLKNPVSYKGSPFSPMLNFGDDLRALQVMGVKLLNRISPTALKSTSIEVKASNGTAVQFTNGQARVDYRNDSGKFWLAQLHTYFWLTALETEMISRTGQFFAKGKAILVDAYNSAVDSNAYYQYTTNSITFGFIPESGGSRKNEVALGSEVGIHEMGHANLHHATSGRLTSNGTQEKFHVVKRGTKYEVYIVVCTTNLGCIRAINEGQADFQAVLMFPDKPAIGETFTNTMAGLASLGISRDVTKQAGKTNASYFASYQATLNPSEISEVMECTAAQLSNVNTCTNRKAVTSSDNKLIFKGEIHVTGIFYSTVLNDIYQTSGVVKKDFEKIYMNHLPLLTVESRFSEGRDALISVAQSMASTLGKDYSTIIRNAFSARGIQ